MPFLTGIYAFYRKMFSLSIISICMVESATHYVILEKKIFPPLKASPNNPNFIWHDLRNYFSIFTQAAVFPISHADERGPHLADGS